MDNILEIKNLNKSFGKHKVIDNISLSIKPGEIYGFLGPNGAGKTTTIKMILGLLNIDSGEIIVNGYDVKKNFEKAMVYVGGIVENPDLYGYMTGYDNLKLYARIRNVKKERINEMLTLVGMEKASHMKVAKYSLGMKQRLGLALTLLHSPKLLILDEPTNGLDPAGIKDLRNILKRISMEEKTAVFVSSHILTEMQTMCDKVAVIDKGKIVKIEEINNISCGMTQEEVELEVKELKETEQILRENNFETKVADNKLNVKIAHDKIPEIVQLLAKNNISIYNINKKTKNLEDIFFNATKNEKGDLKNENM